MLSHLSEIPAVRPKPNYVVAPSDIYCICQRSVTYLQPAGLHRCADTMRRVLLFLCVPCRFIQLEAGLLQCRSLLDASPQDRAAAVDQV